jgi:aryl-alcohol dehydrogenase-like predicted oxidoreductase
MEKRTLGKTGMSVTVLGYGGAEIGFENASQETVNSLLNAALDAGLNVIDTAECYPDSEKKIGEAVAARRKEYFLFTKCGHASGIDLPDWDPKLLELHIERSLRRLKTDCLDLLQLHSCDEAALRKGEVIEVLRKARAAGKTRFIGYSGDSTAAAYAVASGAFDTLQTSCNIADQESIELTLPKAKAAGMGVIVKRPVANAAWRTGKKPTEAYHHAYWDRLQELKYDFLAGDLEKSVSIALRFTLAQEGVTTAIVGTKNPERWAANAKMLAEAGPLDAPQIAAIKARWKAVAPADWVGQI